MLPHRQAVHDKTLLALFPPSLLGMLLCKRSRALRTAHHPWWGAAQTKEFVSEDFISTAAFQISKSLQNTALQCLCVSVN